MILDQYICLVLSLYVTTHRFPVANGIHQEIVYGRFLSLSLKTSVTFIHNLASVKKLTDFTSCVRLCKQDNNCRVVNYGVRMKLCRMVFYKGAKDDVDIRDTANPKFITWFKDILTVSNTKDDKKTEPISYCDAPYSFGDIPIYGNMFTAGSKQAYGCHGLSGSNQYKHVMVCRDGDWSNSAGVCGYEEAKSFRGKRISLKYVSDSVDKMTAFDRCKKEYGGLIKIPTDEKRNFLIQNFPADKVDWWVDAQWDGVLDWVTFDGETVHDHVFRKTSKWVQNLWVNYECATTDIEWKLQPTDCPEHKPYICEMFV